MGPLRTARGRVGALLAALGVLALVGSVSASAGRAGPCSTSMARAGGDWPTYGGDLMGSQQQTAATKLTAATVGSLQQAWTIPSSNYQSVPIVAGGCVFIVDATSGLEALSFRTGQLLWKARGVNTAGSFAVTVHHGLVHIGLQNGGQPVAAAFHVNDGSLAWLSKPVTFGYQATQQSSAIVWTPPRYPHGIQLLTTTGPDFDPYARPGYALIDATTGKILYRSTFIPKRDLDKGYSGGGVWGTPTVDAASGYAFMGTSNPDSQSKEHPYTNAVLKMDVNPARTTFGQIVDYFKGDPDALVPEAYNTPVCQQTGGMFPTAGPYGGSPACTQTDVDFGVGPTLWRSSTGTLMAAILQKSGKLWVLNADTMSLVYDLTLSIDGGPASTNITRVATDGKTLYLNTVPGMLWAIDAETGSTRWQVPTPAQNSGGNVALSHGVVYYVTATGPAAFDATSGVPLWEGGIQGNGAPGNAVGLNNPGDGVAIAGNRLVTTATLGVVTAWELPG